LEAKEKIGVADMHRDTTLDMHQLIMADMHRTVTDTAIVGYIVRLMLTMVVRVIMAVGTEVGVTTGKLYTDDSYLMKEDPSLLLGSSCYWMCLKPGYVHSPISVADEFA
jgi:hypothetical protein